MKTLLLVALLACFASAQAQSSPEDALSAVVAIQAKVGAKARSAATLPQEVRERLTRRRKAGDEDAAVDPLADPKVRSSVAAASFEALVGFQLTQDQLRYNATR